MISIIIPTYNEAENIGVLLSHIQECSTSIYTEVIVVDATNCGITKEVAAQYDARFLVSEKGRARQMNAGAKIAAHDILYFLHADSYPPKNFDQLIESSINGNTIAGCFYMGFDSKHPVLRTSGWFTRFNNNWCRGGDQSLFIKKEAFKQIGGFNEEYTILEDNEIIPRIRSIGNFTVVQRKLITSARRYEAHGVFRLQLIHACVHMGYRLGFSQQSLLNFYKKQLGE